MAYDKIRGITTAQFTKAFLDSIGISPDKCNCGFMRLYTYVPNKENGEFIDRHCFPVVFRYADLNISDENLMDAAMPQLYESFFEKLKLGLYCTTDENPHPITTKQESEYKGYLKEQADNTFHEEQQKMNMIAEEIRSRIEVLRQGGYMELLMHTIGEDLIKQLAKSQGRTTELPRIKVTDDMKIVFPDQKTEKPRCRHLREPCIFSS